MEKRQRIRYAKKDNKLISIEPIISQRTGARYQVFIDLETKTYVIRNLISMKKYEGGEGINNLNVLKAKVKKHLVALGCEFSREKRNRIFGKVPKGYTMEIHLQKLREEQKENNQ